MQHGIALIEPAGLGIHQVLQRSSRQGAGPVLNRGRADLADGARLIGVNQCIACGDGHRLGHFRELELDRVFDRKRGLNLDGLGYIGKAGLMDFELIHAKGQAL